MSGFLLAVDGGGSSTEFCAADLSGNVLCTVTSGSSSFKSVGMTAAAGNLAAGLEKLREQGYPAEKAACGIWGLSGCDTAADQAVYEDMLRDFGLDLVRHHVVNDAVPAFWSAAVPPGAVLIAGTGSIVFGMDSHGGMERIGGWGYPYSDLGSGYWMGAALLRETALWLDGCREEDPIFREVCELLRSGHAAEADCRILLADTVDGDAIAAYARLVLDSSHSPACREIARQAAAYLCTCGNAMLSRLESRGERNLKIVLSGGLFHNADFRSMVTRGLSDSGKYPVIWNTQSPTAGGIRLAMQMFGDSKE